MNIKCHIGNIKLPRVLMNHKHENITNMLSKLIIESSDNYEYKNVIDFIISALEIINNSSDRNIILRICSFDQKLKIYFYFNQYLLMDNNLKNSTCGLFDPLTHKICINATKLLDEKDISSLARILLHELCHLALLLVFHNDSLPYSINYKNNEQKFQKILDECKTLKHYEPIISAVFDNHEKSAWKKELAVQNSLIFIHYHNNPKKLNEIQIIFKNLFDFWNQIIIPSLKETLPVLEKLSNKSNEITFDDLTKPFKESIIHSWVEFQGSKIKLKEIVDEKVLMHLESNKIIKILDERTLSICEKNDDYKKLFYKERNFIDNELKEDDIWYLDEKDKKHKLADKVREVSKDFDEILAEVCQSKIFLLSDHAGTGKSTTMKNFAKKIKEKFPQNWIEFVDLKRHLKVYEKFEKIFLNEKEKFLRILLEILSINEKFEIEIFKFLFENGRVILLFDGVDEIAPYYKVPFLNLIKSIKSLTENQQWIATRPQHSKELKEIFNQKAYKLLTFNEDQAKEFIDEYFKLKGFTDDNKNIFDFINKFGLFKNSLMLKMVADLQIIGKLSNENMSETSLYKDFIEMKKIILHNEKGEIANLDRDKNSKVTIWEIHQIYALKLIFKDNKFGDNFSYGNNDSYVECINFDEFQLFKKWNREKLKWSSEAISRYGLLYVDNWNTSEEFPDFSHKTFAEYFVAQFIFENMKEAIEDGDDLTDKEFEMRMKFALFLFKTFFENRKFILIFAFIKDFLKSIENTIKLGERFIKFLQLNKTVQVVLKRMQIDTENVSYFINSFTRVKILTFIELCNLLNKILTSPKSALENAEIESQKSLQQEMSIDFIKKEPIDEEDFCFSSRKRKVSETYETSKRNFKNKEEIESNNKVIKIINQEIKNEPEEEFEIYFDVNDQESLISESSDSENEYFCSKSFSSKSKDFHKMESKNDHDYIEPYRCKICSTIFENSLQLNRHQRIHQPPKFKCQTCFKAFKRLSTLGNHKCDVIMSSMHQKPIPGTSKNEFDEDAGTSNDLKCRYCKKVFTRRYLLTQHEIIHENPEYFKCELCNKSFKGKFSLDNHKKNIHSDPEKEKRHMRLLESVYGHEDDDSSDWHKCDKCPSVFRNKIALQKHVKVHSNSHRMFCSQRNGNNNTQN
ncbi:hypothetical protein PVAND_014485 [Polypedilum vanderplanki]|uniref:C2H2-type domain-containing protein n=1 Tax=Polypedilum vanderplanki TaxID=319348 RepID=A0A9J6B9S6_POLVA|nr:hypothetical protein PVAND_014485 [Polypedilum vanderplanki]